MEFDEIRAFVAVAEARSASRAARALYLTQPAVTRRMQRLESALGVTLCDLSRRPVTLTEAGQTVRERCRRVAVETYTYDLQLALVARQRGLGLVPARILAKSPLRPRLRVRRIRGLDFPLTIWAVRSPATPDLDAVWDELRQTLAERLSVPHRRSTQRATGANRP